ncbi:MAG: P1 family peptidase [Amphiplicatus sp.]
MRYLIVAAAFSAMAPLASAEEAAPRARDLGVPFAGAPGPLNAITDVPGVTVGHRTIVKDLKGGKAVRTGVTAILPRGEISGQNPVFAGVFALNGNGEMTGSHWVEESGTLEGPVMLTNTHSVGAVHEGVIRWRVAADEADESGYWWSLPLVAETWDGHLNDINGFHVRPEDAAKALEAAKSGPVAEGNVGGGTGMMCHGFKCGIGTASRRMSIADKDYTLGVLVQANYGAQSLLTIAGAPVGKHLGDKKPEADAPEGDTGSIIVVIATDAPLLPHQLKRLARRAPLALGRMGSFAGNGSGDIFIAFSTAERSKASPGVASASYLVNDALDRVFLSVVEATEEAIVNALVAARDMKGDQGHVVKAIDHDALRDVLKKYNRLIEPASE